MDDISKSVLKMFMCDNCLVTEGEGECTCPKGTSLDHCSCDPYFNEPCEACGHEPWTKDRSRPGVGKKLHRPASTLGHT